MMYICMLIHITFFMNIQWCWETWTHIASGYTRIKFKFWIWKGAEIHRLRLSQPLKWSQKAQYYYMTYKWPKQNANRYGISISGTFMVIYILISLFKYGLWKNFRASGIHLAKRALRYGKMRIRGKYQGK